MALLKFDLQAFLGEEIFREETLRRKLAGLDWSEYKDQSVLIRGCGEILIPTWAYVLCALELAKVASKLYFGDEHAPIRLYLQ